MLGRTLTLLTVASVTLAATEGAEGPSFKEFKAENCGKGTSYIWSKGPDADGTTFDLTQHRTTEFAFCLELGAADCPAPNASSVRVSVSYNTVQTSVFAVVGDVMTLVEESVPVLPGVSWTRTSNTPGEITFFYNPAQNPEVRYFSNITATCAGGNFTHVRRNSGAAASSSFFVLAFSLSLLLLL